MLDFIVFDSKRAQGSLIFALFLFAPLDVLIAVHIYTRCFCCVSLSLLPPTYLLCVVGLHRTLLSCALISLSPPSHDTTLYPFLLLFSAPPPSTCSFLTLLLLYCARSRRNINNCFLHFLSQASCNYTLIAFRYCFYSFLLLSIIIFKK